MCRASSPSWTATAREARDAASFGAGRAPRRTARRRRAGAARVDGARARRSLRPRCHVCASVGDGPVRLPLRVPHDAGHAILTALGRADARRARRSRAGVRRARRAPDPAHGRRAARAPRLDDARRAHRAPARARRTRPDDQRGAPRAVRRAVEGGGPRSRQRQPGQPARGPFRRVDAHGPPARRAGRHRRGEARRVSAHQAELRDPARPQRRRSAGSHAFRARSGSIWRSSRKCRLARSTSTTALRASCRATRYSRGFAAVTRFSRATFRRAAPRVISAWRTARFASA
ncbi:putative molybdenum cofactor biosynthesis protein A 2 [Burkholderia pseudomallei]|nr:putative molybdenum cofactor biosynthesis protein A 2 [Burkholderia pseudomallei]